MKQKIKYIVLCLIPLLLASCASMDAPSPNHAGNIDYYLQKNNQVALQRNSNGMTDSEVIGCLFRYSTRFNVRDTLFICN
jgi:PBP1b-binding outer membrane lipoprotein LpoB